MKQHPPVANLDTPSIHNQGPKPVARILSWTPDPLFTMWYAWESCKDENFPRPDSIHPSAVRYASMLGRDRWHEGALKRKYVPSRDDLVTFFRKAVVDWMPITEFIHFTFALENIPRALLDQITRHRHWSFFVQSMRVADVGDRFAENHDYFIPDAIADAGAQTELLYRRAMNSAQDYYRVLRSAGVPIEDARGVLPLHCNTRMIVGFNLRAFQEALRKRTCWILQQQYWAPLLVSMRDELVSAVDPELAYLFEPPCTLYGNCITQIEQEYRLAGKDPNPPCPKHPGYADWLKQETK